MVARVLRCSALIAVAALLCAGLPGRAASFPEFAGDSQRPQEGEPAARKFDEFLELLGECDLGARLDNLAIQLQMEPESKGIIVVYTGKYDLPARVASYRERIGDYLVNTRGIAAERLVILDGGYRQELTTEL